MRKREAYTTTILGRYDHGFDLSFNKKEARRALSMSINEIEVLLIIHPSKEQYCTVGA